ncbi:hypothetical protein [Kocuria sp. CPCC 204721]|uniref:hypothetical protein n=1 Tax=Kocuria sp. CPCC 204721 TaxID=3073548 RepID=UPI0034D446BC
MSSRSALNLFEHDLRRKLQEQQPGGGYDHQAVEEFDLSRLLMAVMNWRICLIPPRPRQVHVSEYMQSQPEMVEHIEAVTEIGRRLQEGADVLPYLSKKANKIVLHRDNDTPKQSRKRRMELDAMLYDWGVYHLHLGTEPDPKEPEYIARKGPLVFAAVSSEEVLMVGIFGHGDWAKEQVAEIITTNWPQHSKLRPSLTGLQPVTPVPPGELQVLRNHGVNVLPVIQGRLHSSAGLTLDGGSLEVADRANNIIGCLQWIDGQVAAHSPAYRVAEKVGWYGLEGANGFDPIVAFPWWYDGENWRPTP